MYLREAVCFTAMLVYEWVIDMHNIYKYFLFVKTGSILVGSVCKQKKPPCFHMAEKGSITIDPRWPMYILSAGFREP